MVQQLYANIISMLTIQSVFCVYTSFSEYVLGWFSPVLFIATHGEQMYMLQYKLESSKIQNPTNTN